MLKLDAVKEEIAYLKLWLGIMVATWISVVGWLIGNFRSAQRLVVATAIVGVVSIAFFCRALHRRIDSKIDEIRRL